MPFNFVCQECGGEFVSKERKGNKCCSQKCSLATNSKNLRKRWQDPEYRAVMSEQSRKLWQDPEYRADTIKRLRDSKHSTITSENLRKRWQDPEYRAVMNIIASKNSRKRWRDDSKYRTIMIENSRNRWQDPEYRATMIECAQNTNLKRKALSVIATEILQNEDLVALLPPELSAIVNDLKQEGIL